MNERTLWRLILRTVGLVVLVAVLGWAAVELADLVLLVLLAAVLATGLARVTARIGRLRLPPTGWRLPPAATVLMIYAVLIAAVVVGGWQLAGPAIQQIETLAASAPTLAAQVERQVTELTGQPGLLAGFSDASAQIAAIRDQINANAGRILGYASTAFGLLTSALFTLVLALYMTVDAARLREGVLGYLPRDVRPRWRAIAIEASHRVAGWLLGQAVLSLVIFGVTAVGLLGLGVPYALGLALAAGALEVLPILGPIVAGVLGVAVAATVDLGLALKVLVLYVVIQQLENNLLVPRIIGQASGLHPLVVMLALLIGSELFGLLGAFLAVPVATTVHVALEHLRRETNPIEFAEETDR